MIQENQEAMKQIEREAMMAMNQRGYIGGIDLMRSLDIAAPEKKYDMAMEERGERQYVEMIRSNPELMQIIDQFIAQQEAQDGQQQSGA
jgi:3-hydroxymyristoyl/3-hydroxydecanoyl-(acyl carrier protein) dehydratase